MKFLLDTQIILWAYLEPERLSNEVSSIIEDLELSSCVQCCELVGDCNQTRTQKEGIPGRPKGNPSQDAG